VLAGGEGLRLRPLVIIKGNDFGEPAYLIEEGQVEASKRLDGQTVHLASLRARQVFGELSMIDEKPRSATVTTVTTIVVSELRPDHSFNSFQTEPKGRSHS
jgi:CRP/FNR family cyclic AMP-dependent transcriptional regulator